MTDRLVKVGTRGSRLAVWQADQVIAALQAAVPGTRAERVIISTKGDRVLDKPLAQIGDKGLFTQELEDRLRDGSIDVAVHSLKDLPTGMAGDLRLGAVMQREDPRDALVCPAGHTLSDQPQGARVGTSSLRRRAQLLAQRPDLSVLDLRGNVPTRVEKVERGEYDATVMARAGLVRLGLGEKVTQVLEPEVLLSAVGQGAIAVQASSDERGLEPFLEALDDPPTRLATAAERALLGHLEGGCQVPIGSLGTWRADELSLSGLVADLDGSRLVRSAESATITEEAEARALGVRLAKRLLAEGAQEILARVRAQLQPPGGVPS